MISNLRILWANIKFQTKLRICLLILLMITSSILEAFSISSVIPFLNSISKGDGDLTYSIIFASLITLAAFLRISNLWVTSRVVAKSGNEISQKIYASLICEDYEKHILRNSSFGITAITQYVENTINFVMRPILDLFTNIILLTGIIFTISLISLKVSFGIFIILGCSYFILSRFTNKQLEIISKERPLLMQKEVKYLQETYGSLKEIILENSFKENIKNFNKIDYPLRLLKAKRIFLDQYQKFVIEWLAFISITLVILISGPDGRNFIELSKLGALAFGFQKLLPILQKIYQCWSQLKAFKGDLREVVKLFKENDLANILKIIEYKYGAKTDWSEIQFKNVSFRYQNTEKYTLENLNITIKKGDVIGIKGVTGCGKSTFINLLIGLIKPTDGQIYLDGKSINDSNKLRKSWMQNISHVPQAVFLKDTTIAKNISKFNNASQVERACRIANVNDFIETLPNKYNTFVGERGIRLSGGQKQRIGIARAVCMSRDILILDESTNALDEKTEDKVLKNIIKDNTNSTIIIISHRPETVKNGDYILNFKNGNLIIES